MKVPLQVYLFLAAGLLAASQSGNIIRLGEAHPVAIAAWRLSIAAILLLPLAGRRLSELSRLSGSERLLLGLAGLSLAVHFFTWIAAVQLTTVANAAIFFSVNPVMVALAGFLIFRERVSWKLALSIALGLGGALVIGLDDFSLHPEHLSGDAWAVASAVFFAAYFLLGKRVRRVLPTRVYVTAVYTIAALTSLVGMLILGLPLIEYNSQTWLCFVLMALVPTMIGHTSFNHALRYLKAGWLSASTLSEPVLAGLVAYFAWGEEVTFEIIVGYVLISASVVVLALDHPEG